MTNSTDDIDAILDAALDELDDDSDEEDQQQQQQQQPSCEDTPTTASANHPASLTEHDPPNTDKNNIVTATATPTQTKRPVAGPPRPPPAVMPDEFEQILELLQNPPDLSNMEADAELNQLFQQLQSQIQSELAISSENNSNKTKAKKNNNDTSKTKSKANNSTKDSVHDAIDALVGDMSQRQHDDHDEDENDINPQDILQQLLQSMNMAGGDNDDDDPNNNTSPDALVETMMQQLLAKDLMYEPMKEVASKFPEWLQLQKSTLSQEEYQQRCQQSQCFQQLVHVYETDPTNTTQLMALMQQVQEYGQPPNEIVQAIAPGLQWDPATGLPQRMEGSEECPIM